jgi:phosphatidylglycerophosphate synthase
MDGVFPTYVWRPLARPLTRMFLRLPFTPNHISVLSGLVSVTGCVIAGFPAWHTHVLGLAILVAGVILDTCDGEVARLRLEQSALGAWIDAIADDVARLALITGIGFHVAANYPDWPILWLMLGALATTLTSMLLIYWYCIFVIGSSSNQDYEAVLGVGNNVEVEGGRKSIGRLLGDALTTMARRAFIDLAVFLAALAGLSWLSFAGLSLGSVVALAVILPAHFRLVREHRAAHRQES